MMRTLTLALVVDQLIADGHDDLAAYLDVSLITPARDLLDTLMDIDGRLRRCFVTGCSAIDAYDTYYQDTVADAISRAEPLRDNAMYTAKTAI